MTMRLADFQLSDQRPPAISSCNVSAQLMDEAVSMKVRGKLNWNASDLLI